MISAGLSLIDAYEQKRKIREGIISFHIAPMHSFPQAQFLCNRAE